MSSAISDSQAEQTSSSDVFESSPDLHASGKQNVVISTEEKKDQPTSDNTAKQQKTEVKRARNYEEEHPFILNFFWCFYFPYICRIAPVKEEDVPVINSHDRCEPNTKKLLAKWDPMYEQFVKDTEEYEKEKEKNPNTTAKKPESPSLITAAFKAFVSPLLIFSLVCLAIANAWTCLEPVMAKYILDEAIKKTYYQVADIALKLLPMFQQLLVQYNLTLPQFLYMLQNDANFKKQVLQVVTEQIRQRDPDLLDDLEDYMDEIPAYLAKLQNVTSVEQLVQYFTKMRKDNDYGFPFPFMITIILCPTMHGLFEALGHRIFFHFAGYLRASLCGAIFEKTLKLNMAAQAGMDSGRLLTLISTDAKNIAEMLPMILIFAAIPVQFFVPLIILLVRLGWTPLISFAVILVVMPIILFLLALVAKQVRQFLRINDTRTKLTNETLSGIRVVKFSGLDSFFINRMINSRAEQIVYGGRVAFLVQQITVLARNLPMLVMFTVIILYVFTHNEGGEEAAQNNFVSELLVRQGYLALMTISSTILPVLLQALVLVRVSFRRINEYLVLPEMKPIEREEPIQETSSDSTENSSGSSNGDIVFQIINGEFEWDSKVTIPKSIGELEAERERLKKEKKEAAKKLDNEKTTDPSASSTPVNNSSSTEVPTAVPMTTENAEATSSEQPSTEKKESVHDHPVDENKFKLSNININIKKGSLTMVIGNVGCGKSSLASTVLGDITQKGGEVRVSKESIAYCPQQAWIINGTVRENITLADEGANVQNSGSSSDQSAEERYQHTVHICALETDFQILAAGDMTSIGEKGVNLSGGQKARIQLARAVYADRDFYVLDDPLSAVDAHVGRWLFDECIDKELRGRGKTVLLTTNQLQFLDRADHVIVLHDGAIIAQGTSAQLREQGIDFSKFLVTSEDAPAKEEPKEKKEENKEETSSSSESSPSVTPAPSTAPVPTPTPSTQTEKKEEGEKAAKQIMTEEEQMVGAIPWKVYFRYWWIILPGWRLPVWVIVFLAGIGVPTFQQYWQGVLGTNQWESHFSFYEKIYWLGWYTLIDIAILTIQALMAMPMERRIEETLHTNLTRSVINCPSSFFDTTPLGRVINRFTGDLSMQDMMLMTALITVLTMWVMMVGQIIVVAIDTPILWAIGGASLVVFWIIIQLYTRSARNFQRLESMARSPVLSVFSECLNGAGLTTIRSYGLEDRWRKKFTRLLDEWTARFVIFREGQKWATTYSSIISSLLMVAMCLIGWYTMQAAKVMVAILAGIMFGMIGVQIVQTQVELDARMTGLQRVMYYCDSIPQEIQCLSEIPKSGTNLKIVSINDPNSTVPVNDTNALIPTEVDEATKNYKVPENWPQSGTVEFDHVSYRYRPRLPFVLKDVSFTFKSGEKIGICGRTGAGKSSLIFPLFRLVELDPRLTPQQVNSETGFLEPVPCDPTVQDDSNTNRGRILIDGVDIANIPLNRLRSSLAIIPQDPTLFTGTLRQNLDFAGQCTDDEIWEVLSLVSLKEMVEALENGLDTEVTEGGRNFSCGQRQLICFARAMLQKTSVVLMDEATANVDVETDAKIQNTIRNVFKKQTVIVVAHRLNTIIGSDRIMVMDHGMVAELDTPQNLLSNPDSEFNGLVRSLSN